MEYIPDAPDNYDRFVVFENEQSRLLRLHDRFIKEMEDNDERIISDNRSESRNN